MKLLLLVAIASGLFAQRVPIVIGFTPPVPNVTMSTCNLVSASAVNQCAYGFRLSVDKTLSAARFYFSVVTASPTTNITASLYASAAGAPTGSPLEAAKNVSTSISAAGWYEFTGFSTALTKSVQYWIVLKNTDGAPQTNGVTIRSGGTGSGQISASQGTGAGWIKKASTDTGATWNASTASNISGSMRLGFSDSSFDGLPISTLTTVSTTNSVYSAREIGVLFTTPAGPTLNVRCLSTFASITGTPTGDLRYRLYTGATATPTLTATTDVVANGHIIGTAYGSSCFATVQSIPPGTAIRIVASETTQSDANTDRYEIAQYTIDDTAASKALTPFGSTKLTLSTDGGANFTDTDTIIIPFGLVLDQTTPFTVAAGTGQTGVVRVN